MLPPLPVAVPLLVAAVLMATSSARSIARRRVADTIATATAAAVTGLCLALLVQAARAPIVYWFGAWTPRHGVALGISFVVDPFGSGLAALTAGLVTAAFVFSWRYFDAVGNLFHVLMLVFLAAMVGFCLSGDLFNIFVFFELMGVAAFALTGYKIEEQGPLQGALNFAITNSIGAFLVLSGLALLYGRTGALNLAQIGRTLAGHPADGLVVTAFALIAAGFFVKAAIVPFHFWLDDAHAVAPTPVCVLFSGVMVELGLYAVVRIYWTVFAGVGGLDKPTLRAVLIAFGVLTALVGAVMCVLQHHLKRLLAFSTVSHAGIFTIGAALLTPLGLAGSAVYVLGHAVVKGALFLCTGILLHRLNSVDEDYLRGRGRQLPAAGLLFLIGGLALASLPPFGTFLGKGMIEAAAGTVGYAWITPILIVASALTGGAVLRATGAVFLGWGRTEQQTPSSGEKTEREPETKEGRGRTPAVMMAPAVVLLALGCLIGLAPGLGRQAETAALRVQDRSAYASVVLDGAARQAPATRLEPVGPTTSDAVSGLLSTAGALAVALIALFRHRLPAPLRRTAWRISARGVGPLRAAHSGHVCDYVTWLTIGITSLGAAFAATILR